jgi:hypothetical protein
MIFDKQLNLETRDTLLPLFYLFSLLTTYYLLVSKKKGRIAPPLLVPV